MRERGADVVLLDLMLPTSTATRCARRSAPTNAIVPIIILDRAGEESDKTAASRPAPDDYMTKPFSVGELLARIGHLPSAPPRARATDDPIGDSVSISRSTR